MSIPEVESRARLIAFLKKFFQEKGSAGGGISWSGSTTDGVATYKDADEATVESNLTFDGTTLTLTGNIKATQDPSGLSDDTGIGEIVTFGSSGGVSLTVGKIYFLKNDGVWTLTDADTKATGGGQMLAIAMGTAVSDGLLLKGFFKASTAVSDWDEGKPVYLSTTSGLATTTAPSATGDFVRIIGYCTAVTDVIYFNPSSTYVEIS